jgi:DNA-binding IclR family transcriptional regulator
MKKQQKTVIIEEKSHVIDQLEKGENISNICYALGLAKSAVHTICNNAEKIKVLSQDLNCVP